MTHFAREYGNALFELAQEEKLAPEIEEQLRLLEDCFSAEADYLRLLAARSVAMDVRLGLIDEAFRERLHPYLLNYLKILTERGAIDRFGECAQMYHRLYNDAYGIAEAVVRSAHPLSEQQRSALIEKLEKMSGRRIKLEERLEPALIGGVQVELEGRRYDNSIRTRLESMRRTLIESE